MFPSTTSAWWTSDELHLQGSLFGSVEPVIDEAFGALRRVALDATSWIDHQPGWLTGDQTVLDRLVADLPWTQRIVEVWDRVLPEPRLTMWWEPGRGPEPLPILAAMRATLSARYGVTFDSIGCNCYRRGDDSVAWHRDRNRMTVDDPLVAIVSVGAPRPFRLRPFGGGTSISFDLGNGDLLVMGGACQHNWEHCVPKVRHAEPRVSITFRHGAR